MVAARTRLEIASENLANASTGGFTRMRARGVLTAFGVLVERQPAATHGALQRTGRDFDLAIVGDGSFAVRDRRGAVTATRGGRFSRERDGRLSDAAGRTLLGAGGRPFTYPTAPASARTVASSRAAAASSIDWPCRRAAAFSVDFWRAAAPMRSRR